MRRTVPELAQRLNRLNAHKANFPALVLMTDAKRLADPSAIIAKLPRGSAVIVRHFSVEQKIEIINKIKPICCKHKVKLLVSDDLKIALAHRLDGVHFSEKKLKNIAGIGFLKKAKPHFIYTSACHSKRNLITAQKAKMDAVLISPIFATQSHVGKPGLGVTTAQSLARQSQMKAYGLGGINQKNAKRLINSAFCGLAGISGLV